MTTAAHTRQPDQPTPAQPLPPARKRLAVVIALWRFVRLLMKWRYGVRGALKPPLGRWYLHREQTLVGQIENLCYRWRHLCWRADSWLYQRTGLPDDWHRWMHGPNK
jgi:hypothetical protein